MLGIIRQKVRAGSASPLLALGQSRQRIQPAASVWRGYASAAREAIDHIINSAAKTYYMSAGQISVPIVFREPKGAAAGVGTQHSQIHPQLPLPERERQRGIVSIGAFSGTRVMQIVKKHDSGGLVWKRIKLTSTRKANAKKRLLRVWQNEAVLRACAVQPPSKCSGVAADGVVESGRKGTKLND